MGIFDQIGSAPPPSGHGDYITPGDYLVTLIANRHFRSRQTRRDTFVVESKVQAVILQRDAVVDATGKTVSAASNKQGQRVSWVKVPEGSPFPEMVMGDLRSYVAALLDVPFEDVGGPEVERAFKDDGSKFVEIPLKVSAHDKPTKSGGMFTVVTWAQPTEGEMGLLDDGAIPL